MMSDKKARRKQWWTTGQVLRKIDSFGQPLPSFNIRGKDYLQTSVGGFVTLMLTLLVLMYAMVKFDHLNSRFNPQMSSYLVDNEKNEDLNLNERGFRVAFAIEDYYAPKRLKNDPTYIKWLFRMWGKKNGISYERLLQAHLCTEADYAEFYPIQDTYVQTLNEIKSDPERGFFCLNWTDTNEPFVIYGTENDDNYQRFELVLMPCNSVSSDVGPLQGDLAEISPECHESLDEQARYIGKSHLLLLFDQVLFHPQNYGKQTLQRNSVIINQQFDNMAPSWLSTTIQQSELQDETGYVQLGYDESFEFLTLDKKMPLPSAWDTHPSKNSTGLYKFFSVELNFH